MTFWVRKSTKRAISSGETIDISSSRNLSLTLQDNGWVGIHIRAELSAADPSEMVPCPPFQLSLNSSWILSNQCSRRSNNSLLPPACHFWPEELETFEPIKEPDIIEELLSSAFRFLEHSIW
jgi:hypothetical protein